MYTTESLHSAVVEIIVKKHGRCRYTTIQNWANNIYNLVTKRAMAYEDSLDGVDRRQPRQPPDDEVPGRLHDGAGRRGEILSIAFASKGQHQDAGAKVVHCAPNTKSRIISKSISKNGGRSSYRGLCKVEKGATEASQRRLRRADSRPAKPQRYVSLHRSRRADVQIEHEASVSRIGEEQLFYLMSRGLSEAEASTMIVSGFIEPLIKELPMEYAVEMNRLIELQNGRRVIAPVKPLARFLCGSGSTRERQAERLIPTMSPSW
jgi:Fe-S cluster assembly protein SufB